MGFELLVGGSLLVSFVAFGCMQVIRLSTRTGGWVLGTSGLSIGLIFSIIFFIQTLKSLGGVWSRVLDLQSSHEPVSDFLVLWQNATLLSALLPVCAFGMLTLTRPGYRAVGALFGLSFLSIVGLFFIFAQTWLLIFVAFELLLLVSIFLLRLTAKSDRVIEAATEMFFWTLVGSLGLIIGLTLLAVSGTSLVLADCYLGATCSGFVTFLLCLGFGVKLPV